MRAIGPSVAEAASIRCRPSGPSARCRRADAAVSYGPALTGEVDLVHRHAVDPVVPRGLWRSCPGGYRQLASDGSAGLIPHSLSATWRNFGVALVVAVTPPHHAVLARVGPPPGWWFPQLNRWRRYEARARRVFNALPAIGGVRADGVIARCRAPRWSRGRMAGGLCRSSAHEGRGNSEFWRVQMRPRRQRKPRQARSALG